MNLSKLFERQYLKSLSYYRSFYDDLSEYGDPKSTSLALYFIPGFNGTCGQIRFSFPSLFEKFGRDIFVRSLFLREFSARVPKWEKYTKETLEKRHAKIVEDITELSESFDELLIAASSTGFYDFYAVYPELKTPCRDKAKLFWIACAPDKMMPSPWIKRFYRFNGLLREGFKWAAVPNNNLLKCINPETSLRFDWRYGQQQKSFFKHDLESRFHCLGLSWDYASPDCVNWTIEQCVKGEREAVDIPTYVLAATNDGYWQGRSRNEIAATIDNYVKESKVIYRPTSHLWVTAPENLSALLDLAL